MREGARRRVANLLECKIEAVAWPAFAIKNVVAAHDDGPGVAVLEDGTGEPIGRAMCWTSQHGGQECGASRTNGALKPMGGRASMAQHFILMSRSSQTLWPPVPSWNGRLAHVPLITCQPSQSEEPEDLRAVYPHA